MVSGIATTSGSLPCAPERTHDTGIQVANVPTSMSSSTFASLYAASSVTSAILSYGPRMISSSARVSASVHSLSMSGPCAASAAAAAASGDPSPGGTVAPRSPTCQSAAVAVIATPSPVCSRGAGPPSILGARAAPARASSSPHASSVQAPAADPSAGEVRADPSSAGEVGESSYVSRSRSRRRAWPPRASSPRTPDPSSARPSSRRAPRSSPGSWRGSTSDAPIGGAVPSKPALSSGDMAGHRGH